MGRKEPERHPAKPNGRYRLQKYGVVHTAGQIAVNDRQRGVSSPMRDGSDDTSSLDQINPRQSLRDRLRSKHGNLMVDVAFAICWFSAVTLLFFFFLEVRTWIYIGLLFVGVPVYALVVLFRDERVQLIIDQ